MILLYVLVGLHGMRRYRKILLSKSYRRSATNTNDDEIQNRLTTLHATYEKATNGEPITGGPTLADLISTIKGCELEEAREIMASIHSLWYNDIQRQRKQTSDTSGQGEQEQIKTVREAIRIHNENVNVRGVIVSVSELFKMIKGHTLICDACNTKVETETYERPRFVDMD